MVEGPREMFRILYGIFLLPPFVVTSSSYTFTFDDSHFILDLIICKYPIINSNVISDSLLFLLYSLYLCLLFYIRRSLSFP
jgi:hypothetical protein